MWPLIRPLPWLILALFLSLPSPGMSVEISTDSEHAHEEHYEISDDTTLQSACQVIQQNATCRDLDLVLTIKSLPRSLRVLTISQARQLTLASGSIRPLHGLLIEIVDVARVDLEHESIALAEGDSLITLNVRQGQWLRIPPRSVLGRDGMFHLDLDQIRAVDIASKAFDKLNRVRIESVEQLTLAVSALKPSEQSFGPQGSSMALVKVGMPVLPSHCFASTDSIAILDSTIGEIAMDALAGIQYQSVLFSGCEINRVQSGAFSEQTLISSLNFKDCTITSLSERSILSAISTFSLENSRITSFGESGLLSQAAKVILHGNHFNTLSKGAISFSSWSSVAITSNQIQFMDSGALLGLSSANEDKSFEFSNNSIAYANQGALELQGIALDNDSFAHTHFLVDCDCDIHTWLDLVCRNESLSRLVSRSSSCQVKLNERTCLNVETSIIPVYVDLMCQPEKTCILPQTIFPALNVFDVYSNKGILLVLLLFALFVSLILIIYTLGRRLVYYFQVRRYKRTEPDWNFTKIEPREPQVPIQFNDNYEELPLANADSPIEEGEKESLIENAAQPPTVVTPMPQLTFYDEVIDLLKDKLDDPNNYATVLDSNVPASKSPEMTLYQNPMEVEPPSNNETEST
ncbi:uncharacterized protein LOC131889437 [Tigriopus californicus]|uniref:uncharacterized protein LOC131889437 n=1 Tax=Tigriopus californicus TaxID=6832 RepID=UPI0027D9E6B4|nr:uncharacterized protein LOC131889437 [Tigriopus californicus]